MKNFIEKGDVITVAAPAAISSGDFVVISDLYGVAQTDAASGDDVAIVREGVFDLPKATGETWAVGDALFWDDGNSRFTKTAGSTFSQRGIAVATAESADTTGSVLVDQFA